MIKASELRIGNITAQGEVVTVYEHGIHVGFGKCFKFRRVEPILITEEWLVQLEFKEKEDISFSYYYKYFKQTNTKGCEQQSKFALGRKGTEVFINNVWICGVEYVHQLQNLYFALTGEELEIKGD